MKVFLIGAMLGFLVAFYFLTKRKIHQNNLTEAIFPLKPDFDKRDEDEEDER